jgi:hypothetical protein
MRMTVPVAQMRITRDLREAEAALDEALLKQASLLATMVLARRETGSEPFLGQEALMRLAKSQQTLLSAGGDLARVHGELLEVQREKGAGEECPEDEKARTTGQRLA